MSLQLNRYQIAGNLTRDPQLRSFSGTPVRNLASFAVATNRRWKDQAGKQLEETTFVDVEAWGQLADFIGKYFGKGSGIYLEGRMKLDIWEKDGVKHQRLKLIAERASFTTEKKAAHHQADDQADDPIERVDPETGEVYRRSTSTRTIVKPAKGGAR